MKLRLLLLSAITAAAVLPAPPAAATHSCGEGLEIVCSAQHVLIDKIDFLVRCKVLHEPC